MDWGNAIIEKINKNANGDIVDVSARLHLEGDFKKTEKKLTWLPDVNDLVKVTLVEFDHLITKKKLEENDEINDFVNRNSRFEVNSNLLFFFFSNSFFFFQQRPLQLVI